MKKIKNISITVILLSALSVSNAYANDTYAVIDSNGSVKNIIVCSAAVCGGGMLGGDRVVAQVSGANGGFMTDPTGQGITVTESNGTFTISDPRASTATIENMNQDSREISSVTVSNSVSTFTFADTVNGIRLTPQAPAENTSAKLSQENIDNGVSTKQEIIFSERKTQDEITIEVVRQQANLILAKIDTFIRMLNKWVK
jgi:hypothetical protein